MYFQKHILLPRWALRTEYVVPLCGVSSVNESVGLKPSGSQGPHQQISESGDTGLLQCSRELGLPSSPLVCPPTCVTVPNRGPHPLVSLVFYSYRSSKIYLHLLQFKNTNRITVFVCVLFRARAFFSQHCHICDALKIC